MFDKMSEWRQIFSLFLVWLWLIAFIVYAVPPIRPPFLIFLVAVTVWMMAAWGISTVDNHDRGKTIASRIQRLLARVLVGKVKPCGCWDSTDAETVDKEPYVLRERAGARIRFTARKNLLRRCKSCGRHYHVDRGGKLHEVTQKDKCALSEIGETGSHTRSIYPSMIAVWPEDEFELREAFDERIEDA